MHHLFLCCMKLNFDMKDIFKDFLSLYFEV